VSLRRSFVFSFIDRYGTQIITFISTLILARLFTPEEFGIYAVAVSVVVLIDVVRDFGISNYVVQERDVTQDTVRAVFTVSMALSMLCAAILVVAATPVAAFYNSPVIARIMPLLAADFLLNPFGMPSVSLMRRDMAFDRLALINLSYAMAIFLFTVSLALLGFGVISFAWAALLSGLVRVAVSIACRPCLWAYQPSFSGWRSVARFGGYSSATAFVNVLHGSLPQIILGRILGFASVGLFGRATNLCQLPDRLFTNALTPVLLSSFASQLRTKGSLKADYLQALTNVTALQWPALVWLALLADPIVRLLLGPQWVAAIPLVRIMSLASLCMFPAFMTYPVLIAAGAVRDALISSLISIPPSILLTFLAAFHGLYAVAAMQFVIYPLQVSVALFFVRRHVRFTWDEFLASLARSGVVAVCASTPVALTVLLAGVRFDQPLSVLALSSVGAAAGWLLGLIVTRHPLLAEVRWIAVSAGRHVLRPPRVP
jgi:O-antigen/teichoic acid export membrane protein